MSVTDASVFSCPYCMQINDIDIDVQHDLGQTLVVDCQVCCQPILVDVGMLDEQLTLSVRQENE